MTSLWEAVASPGSGAIPVRLPEGRQVLETRLPLVADPEAPLTRHGQAARAARAAVEVVKKHSTGRTLVLGVQR
jgi:hypothetical protein